MAHNGSLEVGVGRDPSTCGSRLCTPPRGLPAEWTSPLDDLPEPSPGVEPESPTGLADAVHWYQQERTVLRSTVRRAAELGNHLAVLHLTLDWRWRSGDVDADRDQLPYVQLALDATTTLEVSGDRELPLVLIAECHRYAAAKLARTGDTAAGRRHYDAALQRFDKLGDLTGQANTLRNMAATLAIDPDERVALAARAVQAARLCDVPLVLGVAWPCTAACCA